MLNEMIIKNINSSRKQQRGTSMIEVLVTMIIIVVGLLGIASMQMVSLKNLNSSYQRYVASLYAYDMMERMRTNRAGVAAGVYDSVVVNGSGSVATCKSACNTTQLAAYDIYQWSQQLKTNLPTGTGSVAATADGFIISVSWAEQDTGADLGTSNGAADTQTFSLEVAL
jgi:type IV pilus assembly protein PilV